MLVLILLWLLMKLLKNVLTIKPTTDPDIYIPLEYQEWYTKKTRKSKKAAITPDLSLDKPTNVIYNNCFINGKTFFSLSLLFFCFIFLLKVPHQNSTEFESFWSKSFQLFLNGKIYIIFDHNALLSILYLIFWYFYDYFWGFELSLSVFHDFLAQKLSFDENLFFLSKNPIFHDQKIHFLQNFQKILKNPLLWY